MSHEFPKYEFFQKKIRGQFSGGRFDAVKGNPLLNEFLQSSPLWKGVIDKIISKENFKKYLPKSCEAIIVKNVLLELAKATSKFYPDSELDYPDLSLKKPQKFKFPGVKFGNNVLVGKNVKIGKSSIIGSNTIIEQNVMIVLKQRLWNVVLIRIFQ